MFNHSPTNNAFFDFDPINKKLYVAANRTVLSHDKSRDYSMSVESLIRNIEEGEQVFINYSDREDGEMLLHYGFSYPPKVNVHSYLEISKAEVK